MSEPSLPATAADRIRRLPVWEGPVDIRPLGGGMTNQNFLAETGGARSVVRLGEDIPEHGIVRAFEVAASRAAHAAGIAPAVLYAEPGVLVLEFIAGRTLAAEDVRDPRLLEPLVALLRQAHRDVARHLRGASPMFWVFHVLRDYAHTLREGGSAHAGRLAGFADIAARLERAVGAIDIVFGHNDLLPANIIDDGKKLWLVDWEYAGFNSPLFDLGGLASNSDMPPDLAEALLEGYQGRPVDAALRLRAAAMTAASLLRATSTPT
ncbi:MAG: phosphotransferase, partial [Hyphomicrobiaceae bacterium]